MAKDKKARQASSTLQNGTWFDRLSSTKKDLICVSVIYLVLLVLFRQIVFDNMIFSDAGDTAAAESWDRAISHVKEEERVEPLWIPYIFSGMPSFGALAFPRVVNYIQDYVLHPISKVIFFGADMHWMLLPFLVMGCSMFYFARILNFSPIVSLFVALVVMLNPFGIGLPEVGHGSKLIALGYIPLMLLLTHKLFERRDALTLGLLAAAIGTMLLAKHVQLAMYGLLMVGGYLVYELAIDFRRDWLVGIKKLALFAVAVGVGFSMYAYHGLSTLEYSHYSIRGGGEAGVAGGLSYDYATNWSFHPFELINYLIPSFFGFESPYYWGWMPFTNSTAYIGLVPLIMAGIAIAYKRNRFTWFLILFSAFVFLVSFGKHFSLVYDLMFEYLPFFNKLRAPSMILHVIPITFGLLAAYGLAHVLEVGLKGKESEAQKWRRSLIRILLVIGAVLILGMIFNDALFGALSGTLFEKEGEMAMLRQQYGAQASQALSQFKKLRFELLWKDYVKFSIIAMASLGLMIGFLTRKIRRTGFLAGLVLITIIDLVIYDVRYISPRPAGALSEHFHNDETLDQLRREREVTPFRVLDPSGQLDQENTLMYNLLESVEGYSPAKLKIYQEVRDSCFRTGNRNVFNMLNVKYLLSLQRNQDGGMRTVAQLNPDYLPRAWFVDETFLARSKQEIFAKLADPSWDPRTTAILERELPQPAESSPGATVTLSEHTSRRIVLNTESTARQLLVLSEVYYPAGWKAFIDGEETQIFKTNYILRSVLVPPGNRKVEFTFDPPTYYLGYSITQASWLFVVVLVLFGVIRHSGFRGRFGSKKITGEQAPSVPISKL